MVVLKAMVIILLSMLPGLQNIVFNKVMNQSGIKNSHMLRFNYLIHNATMITKLVHSKKQCIVEEKFIEPSEINCIRIYNCILTLFSLHWLCTI